MEFRSYYAGTSVIRATSPGLRSDAVEITTLGQPKFIPGRTPVAQARPYGKYTQKFQTNSLLTLGLNNPTVTSSEATGHSSRLANDGNSRTDVSCASPSWALLSANNRRWLNCGPSEL